MKFAGIKNGLEKVGSGGELGVVKIAAVQDGGIKGHVQENGVFETGVGYNGFFKTAFAQIRIGKIGALQPAALEVGLIEKGPGKIGVFPLELGFSGSSSHFKGFSVM